MRGVRRRIAVVLVALTAILGSAVAVSLLAGTPRAPSTTSFSPPSSTAATSSAPGDATVVAFKDFSVLPGAPPEAPGVQLQSRLWTIDGRWWAAMVEPVSRQTRIYELSLDAATWSDTGVLLDERAGATADALWSDGHLYVASAVPGRSTSNGVRLSRFSREPSGRFVLDPNFPVRLTERGVPAVSVARDATGRLWIAFVQDGHVLVANSAGDEAVWDLPRPVAAASGSVGPSDVAAVVADGAGRVGLIWSDATHQSVLFASRADDDAPDQWSAQEVAFERLPLSDEPISLAAGGDGSIFVALETGVPDQPNPSQTDPGSVLLTRDRVGAWRSALISRVEDHLGGPIALVDTSAAQVYVIATSPRHGGAVHLKRAEIDRLDFTAGTGFAVITDPSNPEIAFLTSTKQAIDLANGFVVLGFDKKTGIYWHALISKTAAAGPSATPGASAGGSPSIAPPPSALARTVVFIDNFDPWPLDAPIGNGWELAPADVRGSLTAVADTSKAGRNALLKPAGSSTIRVCKSFAPAPIDGTMANVRVRLDGIGGADAVITSLRDPSGDAVSVRFGQGGTFAYYSGNTKVRTAVPIRLATWYRSEVTIHPAARTYDWRLYLDDGTLVVRVKGVRYRDAAAAQVSELCVQTSDRAGVGLRFDDVRISR
jgi:hypothetical protein